MRAWIIGVVLVIAAAIVGIVLLSRPTDKGASALITPTRASEPRDSPPSLDLARNEVPRQTDVESSKSLESVLEEYWGDDWPAVRQKLPKDKDLSTLVDSPLPPWEEVSERIHDMIKQTNSQMRMMEKRYKWQYPSTNDSLKALGLSVVRDLDPTELSAVDGLARGWDSSVEASLEDYRREWNAVLDDAWATEKYRKAPYVLPQEGGLVNVLTSSAVAMDGWTVAFVVPAADYPRIPELRKGIEALADERRASLQEYIESLY